METKPLHCRQTTLPSPGECGDHGVRGCRPAARPGGDLLPAGGEAAAAVRGFDVRLQELGGSQYSVHCDDSLGCSSFHLGWVSRQASQLHWEPFSTINSMKFYMKSFLKKSNSKKHEGFLIIKCLLSSQHRRAASSPVFQLLPIPPVQVERAARGPGPARPSLLLLLLPGPLDRVALYTRLNRTVAALANLNTDPASRTAALDFSLVQDLGRTANLAGLLAGTDTVPGLLHQLAGAGWATAWHAPDCPALSALLTITEPRHQAYQQYRALLAGAGLHSPGLTAAACLLPGLPIPHSLLLAASSLHLASWEASGQSGVSVVSLPGPPTSSLDKLLADQVVWAAARPRTLTVLAGLASPAPTASLPLVLLVPHRVRDSTSETEWRALLTSQSRLSSLPALQPTLLHLAGLATPPRPALHTPGPAQTCALLPVRPTFDCVCRAHRVPAGLDVMAGAAALLSALYSSGRDCGRVEAGRVVSGWTERHPGPDPHTRLALAWWAGSTLLRGTLDTDQVTGRVQLAVRQAGGAACQRLQSGPARREAALWVESLQSSLNPRTMFANHSGGAVTTLLSHNSHPCLWLTVQQLELGGRADVVQLVSACPASATTTISFSPGPACLAWRRGEQRLTILSGQGSNSSIKLSIQYFSVMCIMRRLLAKYLAFTVCLT